MPASTAGVSVSCHLQADHDALSREAAIFLEGDTPAHCAQTGAFHAGAAVDFDDESGMQEAGCDSSCPCPMCHTQPLFLQMGCFLCICGFRLNVKADPVTMQQLKCLLQESAGTHYSSGCTAMPYCIMKV